jgi:hypothetical protein
LQAVQIAHRDVRSDNMLINGAGVLKLGMELSCLEIPAFHNL